MIMYNESIESLVRLVPTLLHVLYSLEIGTQAFQPHTEEANSIQPY